MSQIQNSTLDFLKKLSKNNNREWFAKHKEKYEQAHQNMIEFADALLLEMRKHDQIETLTGKKSLHRIYRDIRFSKDKTPYKKNFSGGFKRATKLLRGGYYYHIENNNTLVGGGFWAPDKDDLKLIREHIAQDDEPLRTILGSKGFKNRFGQLHGDQLKTAPKGFEKDHPAIDLLRYKSFIIYHQFDNDEVTKPDFHLKVNDYFKGMRPFLDYMSEVLTTDLNGEPLNGL